MLQRALFDEIRDITGEQIVLAVFEQRHGVSIGELQLAIVLHTPDMNIQRFGRPRVLCQINTQHAGRVGLTRLRQRFHIIG